MAGWGRPKLGPLGKINLRRPWAMLASPKRLIVLVLAVNMTYCIVAVWSPARAFASVLKQADFVKDNHGIGVVFRLGGMDIQTADGAAFDEDQLPFDGISVLAGKSAADRKKEYEQEYNEVGRMPGAGAIYGGTLSSFVAGDPSAKTVSVGLKPWRTVPSFSPERPYTINPYPKYNAWAWRSTNRARQVSCPGPLGRAVPDVSAFVGLPKGFPRPSFGSYSVLGLDRELCYERDTRLGIYALPDGARDAVDWGQLQQACVDANQARFSQAEKAETEDDNDGGGDDVATAKKEKRTAVLLRSYTGKTYTENDRYTIRSLVSELSLQSGGEYQVFLLVHVKEAGVNLFDNATYEKYIQSSVPKEFAGMTLLWNDALVQAPYPRLQNTNQASVHNAQWLSVQAFMREFREFSYVWNWEMDARITGHAYDMLQKLGGFARKQPRKGLWERNERFYIPDYHGDYDTDFRRTVEAMSRKSAVWGAPDLPFIQPIGPAPPTTSPADDNYKWGVGEEADLITLSPLFDPQGSGWVLGDQVWAYSDSNHTSDSLPRRGAIVTQCRLSQRLVDVMHDENVRGNHVGSEMAPGTVSLLHGLKAVYAPMPVFMDRPWPARRLARWFNNGPRGGSSGGPDSAMGWGREGRFRGSTWYYRADPPQRLYNNWVGCEDNGIGGLEWEMAHGRPCLPAMFLHPVKDVKSTSPGHRSESRLPY